MKKVLIAASVFVLSCAGAYASSGYAFGDGTPENTYIAGSAVAGGAASHETSCSSSGITNSSRTMENNHVAGKRVPGSMMSREAPYSVCSITNSSHTPENRYTAGSDRQG
ncbi:MAG: Hypothetical protein BHV28_04130 [Candidatus Tokpelaia hoelldobleri]|uniref:Secreted protein n=1 Tax=Candidatus Tokpelaia hoelldobleri TaxID=1902579 RepID=A0A1U9JTD3_9HYPH|nr:MAG: Hypothetical protein BHV28_04130 [Candidatus Tokpelaia hoelldoblerii]